MGIRVALGASVAQILALVLRNGMLLTLIGVVMGIAGSLVLTKVISGLLYGITATDTPTYIATVVLFAAVAFIYSNSHPSARRGNHRSGGSHPA